MGYLKGKEMTGKSNIIPSLNFGGPEHNWRRRIEGEKEKEKTNSFLSEECSQQMLSLLHFGKKKKRHHSVEYIYIKAL